MRGRTSSIWILSLALNWWGEVERGPAYRVNWDTDRVKRFVGSGRLRPLLHRRESSSGEFRRECRSSFLRRRDKIFASRWQSRLSSGISQTSNNNTPKIDLNGPTDYLMLAVSGGHVHSSVVKSFLNDSRSIATRDQITWIRPNQIFNCLFVPWRARKRFNVVDGGRQKIERNKTKTIFEELPAVIYLLIVIKSWVLGALKANLSPWVASEFSCWCSNCCWYCCWWCTCRGDWGCCCSFGGGGGLLMNTGFLGFDGVFTRREELRRSSSVICAKDSAS